MKQCLFGLEAELAVSATRSGQAVPPREIASALAESAQLTLAHLPGGGSRMFLLNGGLFYVDCGEHPEVATPECTMPSEAVCHLRAAERMVAGLARMVREKFRTGEVLVCRSNVDYHSGATWGCHESYLGSQRVTAYQNWLIPHLASRIVYTGAGGLDPLSPGIRLSISPRVSHIDQVVSQESTSSRGIFHTRNESLCSGYSRIHVLCGDNACSQRATWLKTGTTALVVALADAEGSDSHCIRLADPVGAMKGFARDLGYRTQVQLKCGARSLMTATEIQRHLLSCIEPCVGRPGFPDWAPAVCAAWKQALDLVEAPAIRESHAFDWSLKFTLFRREIAKCGFTERSISAWSDALERVARSRPLGAEGPLHIDQTQIDSLRKARVLADADLAEAGRMLAQQGLSWQGLDQFSALRRRLCAVDIRFGEVGAGIFEALDRQGVIPDHRMVTEAQIEAAVTTPPAGSRAAVRGRWVKKLAGRRSRYICGWNGIAGKRLRLDLSDPFAAKGKWARAPIGLEEDPSLDPASTSVSAHPLINAVQRAVAARNMNQALALARAALESDAVLPLGACAALLRTFEPLVPNCAWPVIDQEPDALEAVLLGIRERVRRLPEPRLEDAVATPLYRLYEGIGRYDSARSVLAELLERASRGGDNAVPAYLINNHAYEDLLAGHWTRAAAGFERAQAAYEGNGSQCDLANVRANILICRFSMLPPGRWRSLLQELRCVNRLLWELRDWRARKTLILLARYAEARGRRAAAIGWARRAVRAATGIATRHRIEDERYLHALEAGQSLVGQLAVD